MNWIDIILLIILVIFVAIGFWKGFVFSVLSLFSVSINFILGIFLTKPINIVLNKVFSLEGALTNAFSNKISGMHEGFSTNLVGLNQKDLNTHIANTLKDGDFPFEGLFKRMLSMKPETIQHKESLTLNEILSKSLGTFFSLVISFAIAFLLIYLVLWLIGFLTKKAKQVEGIRVIDRILGVLFGLVRGAIVIATIFAVLSFFNEEGVLHDVFNYIDQSSIGSWIYQNMNTLVDKYLNFKTIVKTATDTIM